ncbi:MAG: transketolase [Marinilabiliales bacterium]|nr:MAG: transketolase [Marinilabiliales bacterium]
MSEEIKHNKRTSIPTRVGFGEGLEMAAKKNCNVIGLGGDITGSVNMNIFSDSFPNRFYSLGIAEQNIAGVATGLALEGKIPVFASYAVFSALRTTDQIRVSICYNNLHVIIGGAHAGISVGPDGATHQALEDIAIMRVLPNMTVLSPCDYTQTKQAIQAAINNCSGPVYIRFGREAVPDFSPDEPFIVGQAQQLNYGNDLTIFATGHMVWESLEACKLLLKENIKARVINIHTIKPLDEKAIEKAAIETGAFVCAEEHQIYGGMGSAIAEAATKTHPVPIEYVGINDRFGESGPPAELMKKFNLTSDEIYKKAKQVLKRKHV